ncbi:MAG: epoxyqueuosine reductase QueH, partial [Oscillospiraceae bacterium]|nr:epoxyqueuosine reductase QueH [Oscillospiraceae bacterium]
MQKVNYGLEMEREIALIGGRAPRLLLQSCCAPCSSSVLEKLAEHFRVTVYYYNPNISPEGEFYRRAEEQKRLISEMPLKRKVDIIIENYDESEFLDAVRGLENEPEGGKRCSACFHLRLEKTAQKARGLGFDYFTTTLTVSPLKDAQTLNSIGLALGEKYGVKFLPSDFKKRDGYKRSIELSEQYGLYRQDYCGCRFS